MIKNILKWAGIVILVLLVLVGATYAWIKYQTEIASQDPESIAEFYSKPARRPDFAAADREACAENNPLRNAYFGATHVHTSMSYDSTAFGVTNTADETYAFSRGARVPLRLQGEAQELYVPTIQLRRPLDFATVTDHAERMGESRICYDPAAQGYNAAACKFYRGDWRAPVDELLYPLVRLASQAIFGKERPARICGEDGSDCRQRGIEPWADNQRAAEKWYDRSSKCEFTSFVGYEYSLAVDAANLHRNVIFANASVPPRIVSAVDMPEPEQLWSWLKRSCLEEGENCDVLTIPHNSNWSSGRMWFPYSLRDWTPEQQRQAAQLRNEMEPIAEIMQVKGDSECRNGLSSVFGGADELCEFEKLRPASVDIEDCGDTEGAGGMMLQGCESRFSYLRYALSTGLAEQKKLGVNPFKLGIIAASDNHNGTPAAELEQGHMGANGTDRDAVRRLMAGVEVPGGIAKGSPIRYGPGGVAGIWAEENTRESLFAAMKRRETFGTSGPRITPRMFAGWAFSEDICNARDMVAEAYQAGVAMGSDLPARPADAAGVNILVSASRDPMSYPLQRIQVIKGWVDAEGKTRQAVYDVAGDPHNGASVDTATCETSGSGFAQLCTVWQDPDFDPEVAAVYYSRVVENPSCRWSTYDCNALPADKRPASCDDPTLPKAIQERAWTSPVWYQPL